MRAAALLAVVLVAAGLWSRRAHPVAASAGGAPLRQVWTAGRTLHFGLTWSAATEAEVAPAQSGQARNMVLESGIDGLVKLRRRSRRAATAGWWRSRSSR